MDVHFGTSHFVLYGKVVLPSELGAMVEINIKDLGTCHLVRGCPSLDRKSKKCTIMK